MVVGAVFLLDRKYEAETNVLTTDPGVYEQGAQAVSGSDLRPSTNPAPLDSKPAPATSKNEGSKGGAPGPSLATAKPQPPSGLQGASSKGADNKPQQSASGAGGAATSATASQKPAVASTSLPSAVKAANPGLAPPVPASTKPATPDSGKPKEGMKQKGSAKPGPAATAAAKPDPNKPKSAAPLKPVEPKPEPKPKPPQPAPKPAQTEYTVRSGDNPWDIAQKYGVEMKELLALNNIKNPKNLKIGQVLKLPQNNGGTGGAVAAKSKPQAKPALPSVKKPAAGDKYSLYTIKKGENPWSIAKKLKVSHQSIIDLNKNLDFRDLKIGQEIKVPKK